MLNFQVEDINAYVEHIKKLDITIVKELERSDYGSFLWIADPDGRWIELWEKNNE
ncbi:VOC family protein [Ureibacillus sp. MALMAid1270]|uniref:VOC family protein n=1 Tax=Ureibacillus sp. MALMAid1270 TaxID=3411629 RepID=UPI003BA6362B